MKKILYILSGALLMISSCTKDVLDKKPLDVVSDATIFEDENLVEGYMAEVYIEMYMLYNETPTSSVRMYDWEPDDLWYSSIDWAGPYIVNELSDESKDHWLHVQNGYKMGGIYIHGGLLEWWEYGYKSIRDINFLIENIGKSSTLSEDYINEKIAEARFLRAYNYFAMVKRYGGVPLHTKVIPFDAPDDVMYKARAKEQDVYDFIISELDEITDLLSETGIEHPSKYAALALKSRAALYAASIAKYGKVQLDGVIGIAADPNIYYQKAFDAGQKIITEGPFALLDAGSDKVQNFKNVFITENHNEKIWVVAHDGSTWLNGRPGGNSWCWDFMQAPKPHAWSAGNKSAPYLEMAEEFEYIDSLTPGQAAPFDRNLIQQSLWTYDKLWAKKDPRFHATLYTNGTEWQGTEVDYHLGILLPNGKVDEVNTVNGIPPTGNMAVDNSFGTGFGVMKYLDESHSNTGERGTSATDWQIFRYAEILLNTAEAAFEMGGEDAQALGYINDIRNRAGIRELTSLTLDNIRHERKIELAFEGHRYWDLRRWRTATDVLTVNRSGVRYIRNSETEEFAFIVLENIDHADFDPIFKEHNYYFPITMPRTSANPNLVENPGYK